MAVSYTHLFLMGLLYYICQIAALLSAIRLQRCFLINVIRPLSLVCANVFSVKIGRGGTHKYCTGQQKRWDALHVDILITV